MESRWVWLVPPALIAPASSAHAIQYLTVERAQQALFASATRFEQTPVVLSDAQKKTIEKVSPTRTPLPTERIWKAWSGGQHLGYFIVDEVYGKHEFITYAVAIDPAGAVLGIEIMDYRETHGGQVREPSWRRFFIGKTRADPLKLDGDIPNISGATMSCKHITEGVRRLLALYELALKGM